MPTLELKRHGIALLLSLICLSGVVAQDAKKTTESETKEKQTTEKLLAWNNGNVLPGTLVKGDEKEVYWISDLFRGELQVDLSALNNVKFPRDESQRATQEKYFVRTLSGDKLYGDIEKVDADGLVINSERHGRVVIKRENLSNIVHLGNAGYVFMGVSDLEDWGSLKRTKKHWKISDSGDLESTKNDINLFYQTELPDAVQIDLVIKWKKNLDLVFGLGVPSNTKVLDKLPRIESWEDSLVLNQEEDFEIVYDTIEDQTRLVLQIQWDRKTNKVQIRDEKGAVLCETTVPKEIRGIKPGIYLENKKGDMQIETLRISKIAAGYDPSKRGVQLTDGTIAYGELASFDGTNWEVNSEDSEETEMVASDQFRTALINTPREEEIEQPNTLVRFQDGALLTGTLVSIDKTNLELKTEFSDKSVLSRLEGISVIRFLGQNEGKDLKGTHTLYSSQGELFGQVFAGSGEDSDVIRWRPVGCRTGLPLTNADARITLSDELMVADKQKSQWPDTIYFVNKDTIPCRIISVDDKQVVFESFAENDRVDQQLIKAVDFSAMRISGAVSCNDPGWYFSDKAKESIEVTSKNEMVVRGTGRFGHHSLASIGTLKFQLQWKSNSYNSFECRSFVRSPKNSSGGLGVTIMLWDNMVMISDAGQNQMTSSSQIAAPNNKANIEFEVANEKLTVRVNGKRAFSKKVSSKAIKGNATTFSLKNMNGNGAPQVTFGNITINNSGDGASPVFIDQEKKDLLLTIPRLRKDNPPTHILCARNSDFLRGELTVLDEQRVLFQSRFDSFTFDRNLVSSIVWLHAKTPKQLKEESEKSEETDDSSEDSNPDIQVVQIIMKGGQRLTVDAKSWNESTFDGISKTLGNCSIPINEIRELRLGKFATDATDVAYADWVAVPAITPVIPGTGEANQVDFGKDSPLIGQTAKDFTMKMLDGSKFKLSENKGKVIVLDFWATWCGPCVRALPDMVKATDSFDPNKVVFIAVNQLEEPELIKMFVKRRSLDMKVGLDNGDIGDMFEVTSIPQTVIIDAEGKIAFSKVGSEADLQNKMYNAIKDVVGEGAEAEKPDSPLTPIGQ